MKKRYLWVAAPMLLAGLVGYRLTQISQVEQAIATEIAPVKVEVSTLRAQPLTSWVFSEGTVQAKRKAFLDFQASGKVESIATLLDGTPLREGARVFGPTEGSRNGQLLAQIDSRDNLAAIQGLEARLKSMQAQKREAEARLKQAENERRLSAQNFKRMQDVYKKGVISQDEFDRVKTADLNAVTNVEAAQSGITAISSEIASLVAELDRATLTLEKTSLFAPFDGVITAMNIREDNTYYPPMSGSSDREREANSAIVIVDDSEMEIQLEIGVAEAANLREGLSVYLAADDQQLYEAALNANAQQDATDSQVAIGQIWSISPAINLQRRTQTVKVRVEQVNEQLREGQFVRAWIAAEHQQEAVALPLSALSFSQGKPFVYVVNPQGNDETQQVERRDIALGVQGLALIEVTQGLALGETIVVRGQHLLVDGSEIVMVGDTQ